MDKTVSVRFYRVSPPVPEVPDFPELLIAGMGAAQPRLRERVLDGGVSFRLERCVEDQGFVTGEICRKQTVNIPPEVRQEGLAPVTLGDGNGLGHVAAFRYHRGTRVLALQYNLHCGSANRVSSYLAAIEPRVLYTFSPILREDGWERFQNRQVRGFEITFSSPANLEVLNNEVAAVTGARMIGQAYNGLAVTIKVGVGRKRRSILDFAAVRTTIQALTGGGGEIETIKVDTGSAHHDRFIDFLEEHMKESRSLDLDGQSPDENYAVRRAYLQEVFAANMGYLNAHFGG